MRYSDLLYGELNLDEQVLIDLIASPAVTRLQGVLQHGISGLIGITSPLTRFDHSLGVMILVRRLEGSLREQIAALLHDVSHTAFSHVVDYVFDNHNGQSFHDEQKANYLKRSDIPRILADHGYDWTEFLDESRFPILEQPAPRLCADRLDYFLRDSLDLGLATMTDVQNALAHLLVTDGRIITDSRKMAAWLGDTYMAADEKSWANFQEVGIYEATAQAIRRGLEIGLINDADLWGTDQPLWRKLLTAPDVQLQAWLRYVSPEARFTWDDQQPTFRISTKIRTIDPDILLDEGPQPLSAVDPEFARRRLAYIERKSGIWPMRAIPPQT